MILSREVLPILGSHMLVLGLQRQRSFAVSRIGAIHGAESPNHPFELRAFARVFRLGLQRRPHARGAIIGLLDGGAIFGITADCLTSSIRGPMVF